MTFLTTRQRHRSFIDGPRGRLRVLCAAVALATMAACNPTEELVLADGSEQLWSTLEGDWLLVNYWAKWCAPCRVEVPELNELHEAGTTVLGVNFDGLAGSELQADITDLGIRFPVALHDPRERWGARRPEVLPTTLVVAPDGSLHAVLVGPQTRESLMAAMGNSPDDP
ncbi:MAG: TlpA disulfide reductase family protein [Gammaproteobacteria bacterium]|nr:TlpA disulfide reductase family protein [Gammaproteobacteria bacterium]